MDDCQVEIETAAYALASRALQGCASAYFLLLNDVPTDKPLDDATARAVGGAVLFYGLYCRLLELQQGPGPRAAMQRAFARLESDPEFSAELVVAIKSGYEKMLGYKIFRANVTILEFISERAWNLAYPGEDAVPDSAFQKYVEILVSQSYGKLQGWTLV